jgi:hypothetical protein
MTTTEGGGGESQHRAPTPLPAMHRAQATPPTTHRELQAESSCPVSLLPSASLAALQSAVAAPSVPRPRLRRVPSTDSVSLRRARLPLQGKGRRWRGFETRNAEPRKRGVSISAKQRQFPAYAVRPPPLCSFGIATSYMHTRAYPPRLPRAASPRPLWGCSPEPEGHFQQPLFSPSAFALPQHTRMAAHQWTVVSRSLRSTAPVPRALSAALDLPSGRFGRTRSDGLRLSDTHARAIVGPS